MNTKHWKEFREKTLKDWDRDSPKHCLAFLNGNVNSIDMAFCWSESPHPVFFKEEEDRYNYWEDISLGYSDPSKEDFIFVKFMSTGVLPTYTLPPGGDWE